MEPGSKEIQSVETSVGISMGKRNLPMQTDEINFKILIIVLSNSSLPSERSKLQLVFSQASYVEIRHLYFSHSYNNLIETPFVFIMLNVCYWLTVEIFSIPVLRNLSSHSQSASPYLK